MGSRIHLPPLPTGGVTFGEYVTVGERARPWADENLGLTAETVLPGSVSLCRACVGQAALGVVGRAEVGADPVADRFHGGAGEGLGDALWGPGAD